MIKVTKKMVNLALILVLTGALVVVMILAVNQRLQQRAEIALEYEKIDMPQEEVIAQTVADIKSETSFPLQIDEATRLLGIKGTSSGVKYEYLLSGIDEDQFDNEILKNIVSPVLCQEKTTRRILNEGINLEYSYDVQDSNANFSFVVNKNDCQ